MQINMSPKLIKTSLKTNWYTSFYFKQHHYMSSNQMESAYQMYQSEIWALHTYNWSMCKLKFTNIIKMSHTNICYCQRHTHHSMRSFFLSSCLGSFDDSTGSSLSIDLGGLDHFNTIGGKPNISSGWVRWDGPICAVLVPLHWCQ